MNRTRVQHPHLIHVGDSVVVDYSDLSLSVGMVSVPNGTQLTVIGFQEEPVVVGRTHALMDMPSGFYRRRTAVRLTEPDHVLNYIVRTVYTLPATDLLLKIDEQALEKRSLLMASVPTMAEPWTMLSGRSPMSDHYFGQRVQGLPSTLYFEGDLVSSAPHSSSHFLLGRVEDIRYAGEPGNENAIVYIVRMLQRDDHDELTERGYGNIQIRSEELHLEQRGNHWKWEYARNDLSFKDAVEQAKFYDSIGESLQVDPPDDGPEWTFHQAIEAMERGEVDMIKFPANPYGLINSLWQTNAIGITAWTFPAFPEAGRQIREGLLAQMKRDSERLEASLIVPNFKA